MERFFVAWKRVFFKKRFQNDFCLNKCFRETHLSEKKRFQNTYMNIRRKNIFPGTNVQDFFKQKVIGNRLATSGVSFLSSPTPATLSSWAVLVSPSHLLR